MRILLCSIGLFLLACAADETAPQPTTPLAEETIDDQGGTIVVPGTSLSLVFPAGALDTPTEIEVFSTTGPGDAIGTALRLEPDGTQFNVPAELRFTYDVGDLPSGATPDDLRVVTREGNDWVDVPMNVDVGDLSTGEIAASLAHFSDYAVIVVDPTLLLRGTFGFAEDHAYAYTAGSIYRHDGGTTVSECFSRASAVFADGWGSSANDQYVVGFEGFDGRIWSSTDGQGTSWTDITLPAGAAGNAAFVSIAGSGTDLVAVGYGGRIARRSSGTWTDESYRTTGGVQNRVRNLNAVTDLGNGEAIAVGNEIVLHRVGGSWAERDMSGVFGSNRFFLHGVWARSATEVWAAGWEFVDGENEARVLSFNGSTWAAENLPANLPLLQGVWGDDDEVYAVGRDGTVVVRESGIWTDQSDPACVQSQTLYDVWAMAPDSFHMVGAGGVLLRPGEDCIDVGGNGGGGGGSGDGDLNLFLDQVPATVCDESWSENGVDLRVVDTIDADAGMCFVPTCEFYTFDGKPNLLCGRLEADLGGGRFAYRRIEVDVSDNCNEGNCTRVYLYDQSGNLINLAQSQSQSREEVTVVVDNAAQVVVQRVVVLMTYGQVEEIRFYEN